MYHIDRQSFAAKKKKKTDRNDSNLCHREDK